MTHKQHLLQLLSSNSYKMIDVGKKIATDRCALAQGRIYIGKEAFDHIKNKTLPKGDPLALAEVAGINGAKSAFHLIPLCHPLCLDQVSVTTVLNENDHAITVYCLASALAKTGVEMEALAGVNAALLTIYDLCKMVNPDLAIEEIRLLFKEGGKKGLWIHAKGLPDNLRSILDAPIRPLANVRTSIMKMSDRAFNQVPDYPDIGIHLKAEVERLGAQVTGYQIYPDEKELIKQEIKKIVKEQSPDLLLIHGGTGLSARDVTAEAVTEVADRLAHGIGEFLRKNGEKYTPYTWLSNCLGAVLGKTLIIAIPGSKNSIYESMEAISQLIGMAIEEINKSQPAM